jgi:iron-sulfur cluster repair protein YtfE (RIC family)
MKRHPALIQLSREHHSALVLVKRARGARAGDPVALKRLLAEVSQAFAGDLEAHFLLEELHLLPALLAGGQQAAVERTLAEHAALRALAEHSGNELPESLQRFGEALAEHIRFEERELFPLVQAVLGEEALNILWPGRDAGFDPAPTKQRSLNSTPRAKDPTHESS